MDILTDYYSILGLGFFSSIDDVQNSYKKLIKKSDVDGWGEGKKRSLFQAYSLLSDPKSKENYDTFHRNAQIDKRDIIVDDNDIIFKKKLVKKYLDEINQVKEKRGKNVMQHVKLTLDEVYHGCHKTYSITCAVPCRPCSTVCHRCQGNGKIHVQRRIERGLIHRSDEVCWKCEGRGYMPILKRPIHIQCKRCCGSGTIYYHKLVSRRQKEQFTMACKVCDGKGHLLLENKTCETCQGTAYKVWKKMVTINFPPGIYTGYTVLVRNYGEHLLDGRPGHYIFQVEAESEDALIRRQDEHLYVILPIPLIKTLTGSKYNIKVPSGEIQIDTRAFGEIVAPGKTYVAAGRGLPKCDHDTLKGEGYGDVFINFKIIYPKVRKDMYEKSNEGRLAEMERLYVDIFYGSSTGEEGEGGE
jgi:DnaJ-class molecular chaperone